MTILLQTNTAELMHCSDKQDGILQNVPSFITHYDIGNTASVLAAGSTQGHAGKGLLWGCLQRATLRTVLGSPAFLAEVRPRVEPLRSYRLCRRTSVGNTLPITTNLACRSAYNDDDDDDYYDMLSLQRQASSLQQTLSALSAINRPQRVCWL